MTYRNTKVSSEDFGDSGGGADTQQADTWTIGDADSPSIIPNRQKSRWVVVSLRILVLALLFVAFSPFAYQQIQRIHFFSFPVSGYVSSASFAHAAGAPAHPVLQKLANVSQPLIWPVAHRGDREWGPENSIASIVELAKRGFPIVEVDVRWSSVTKQLFLMHDRRLHARTLIAPPALLERKADSLSQDELERLSLLNGEKLPFLKDALAAVRGTNTVLDLDLKNKSRHFIDQLAREIYAAGAEGQVILQVYNPYLNLQALRYLRTHYPKLALGVRTTFEMEVDHVLPYSPEIVHVEPKWLTPELAQRIHNAGGRVLVKMLGAKLDNRDAWNEVIRNGADLLMTDKATYFWEQFRPAIIDAHEGGQT